LPNATVEVVFFLIQTLTNAAVGRDEKALFAQSIINLSFLCVEDRYRTFQTYDAII
jgi:hypothetical protein